MVVPVLNMEQHIDQCLSSLFSQTGDARLAIHVQDGGSTDRTLEIVKDWSRKVKESQNIDFSFSTEPDGGPAEAINRGFERVDGDLFTWIGADDFLLPWTTSAVLHARSLFPEFEWITGRPFQVDESGFPLEFSSNHEISFATGFSTRNIVAGKQRGGFNPIVQQEGTFWTKAAFAEIGGQITQKYRLAFDYALWLALAKSFPLLQLSIPLGAFRRRKGQLSSEFRTQYWAEVDEMCSPSKGGDNRTESVGPQQHLRGYFKATYNTRQGSFTRKKSRFGFSRGWQLWNFVRKWLRRYLRSD